MRGYLVQNQGQRQWERWRGNVLMGVLSSLRS